MRSNVCKIENGTKDLAAILKESEKVAVYNELTNKQMLQLRLICEEIDGMLPNIIDDFKGELWIDYEDGLCRVNVSLRFDEFTAEKKEGLVGISKNKKNAAAVGILGRIRSSLEDAFMDEDVARGSDMMSETFYYYSPDVHDHMDYSYRWSLEQYRNDARGSGRTEEWDELEKSVIASVADDIIVGVRGKRADIVVVKRFA